MRVHFSADRSDEDLHGGSAGAAQVDVRAGLVAHDDVGLLTHAPRHVGVEVERCSHREIGSNDVPHHGEDLPFGIVEALRDHGAVQAQHHAIDPVTVSTDPVADLSNEMLERDVVQRRSRLSLGIEQWDQFDPELFRCVAVSGHFPVACPFEHSIASDDPVALEVGEGRRPGNEAVTLLAEQCHKDSLGRCDLGSPSLLLPRRTLQNTINPRACSPAANARNASSASSRS